jgi:hypothetical protein
VDEVEHEEVPPSGNVVNQSEQNRKEDLRRRDGNLYISNGTITAAWY